MSGNPLRKDRIWVIISSHNQYQASKFLKSMGNTDFVGFNYKTMKYGADAYVNFHGVLKYFDLRKHLNVARLKFGASVIIKYFNTFIKGIGVFEFATNLLVDYKPKAIIVTNDHLPHIRSFVHAAIKLKIPTVYIQHASVTQNFPPLIFDLSLLEGSVAYRMYGERGNVKFIGMPKFDNFLSLRKTKKLIKKIGIAFTTWDEAHKMKELMAYLIRYSNKELVYRHHPRESRKIIFRKSSCSDTKKESFFEFLNQIDFLVAGDTSAHLEACLMNIPSAYYSMNNKVKDYYGYIEYNLCNQIEDLRSLSKVIHEIDQKPRDVYFNATPFNAFVGKKLEGTSGQLVKQYIKRLINE